MKDISPPPCITNKCLKYPICKYKESIECEEIYIYCKKLYVHYKNISNQLKHYDAFNNIYSKAIENLRTSFPNLKEITGMWKYIYKTYTKRI